MTLDPESGIAKARVFFRVQTAKHLCLWKGENHEFPTTREKPEKRVSLPLDGGRKTEKQKARLREGCCPILPAYSIVRGVADGLRDYFI
jgi:hypothetical protein